jgi:acyl carrier protein
MELMMSSNSLSDVTGIVQRFGRIKPGAEITPEARFVEDLAIDSLDLVDVLLKIQDHFDIAIDDEDVPNLRRVSDLASYVDSRRGSAAA